MKYDEYCRLAKSRSYLYIEFFSISSQVPPQNSSQRQLQDKCLAKINWTCELGAYFISCQSYAAAGNTLAIIPARTKIKNPVFFIFLELLIFI